MKGGKKLLKAPLTVDDAIRLANLIRLVVALYAYGDSVTSISEKVNILESEVYEILEANDMA